MNCKYTHTIDIASMIRTAAESIGEHLTESEIKEVAFKFIDDGELLEGICNAISDYKSA